MFCFWAVGIMNPEDARIMKIRHLSVISRSSELTDHKFSSGQHRDEQGRLTARMSRVLGSIPGSGLFYTDFERSRCACAGSLSLTSSLSLELSKSC